jgi:hypothetical protein
MILCVELACVNFLEFLSFFTSTEKVPIRCNIRVLVQSTAWVGSQFPLSKIGTEPTACLTEKRRNTNWND